MTVLFIGCASEPGLPGEGGDGNESAAPVSNTCPLPATVLIQLIDSQVDIEIPGLLPTVISLPVNGWQEVSIDQYGSYDMYIMPTFGGKVFMTSSCSTLLVESLPRPTQEAETFVLIVDSNRPIEGRIVISDPADAS